MPLDLAMRTPSVDAAATCAAFGEGVLRQAVVGCLLGILDRSFEQDVGVHEFVHHAHRVSLYGIDDLAEQACAHRHGVRHLSRLTSPGRPQGLAYDEIYESLNR